MLGTSLVIFVVIIYVVIFAALLHKDDYRPMTYDEERDFLKKHGLSEEEIDEYFEWFDRR